MTVNINPPKLNHYENGRFRSNNVLAFSKYDGWYIAYYYQYQKITGWKIKGGDGYDLEDVLCWVELMTPEEVISEYQKAKNVS